MLFTGHYEHLIDAKNRLAIPADIRARWTPQECGGAWFALPWPTGVIRLYTEVDFTARANQYQNSLTPAPDQAELQATLFGLSRRLEMDSAGRIRLPDELLALTGLPREVSLVGAGEWIEVRNRIDWRASIKERLEQLPTLMLGTQSLNAPSLDRPPSTTL